MDNNGVPPVADTGYNSAAPDPATPVATPPVQVQQVPVTTPTFQSGGKTGVAKFFDGVTVTDVIAMTMFFGLLTLGIVYYRRKIKFMKSDQAELIDKVESLEEDVNQIKGGQQGVFGG